MNNFVVARNALRATRNKIKQYQTTINLETPQA